MDVDALAERYRGLVIVACEWRAMGLADPEAMADEVFARLGRASSRDLRDVYREIDRVVMASFRRHAEQVNPLDRLRDWDTLLAPPKRAPTNPVLKALSNLRARDREVLQLRFWDGLTEDEAAEVLGTTSEAVRRRVASAGDRLLARLSRSHPGASPGDIADVLASIKPGVRHRG